MKKGMLKKTTIVLTVLTLSFFVMFLSGCTMNSVSKRLKSKHYIVKVETKKPEVDKGDVIKKELFAYNTSTGDEIKGTEYISKADAERVKAALAAEAKVNQARVEALEKKKAEAEEAAKAAEAQAEASTEQTAEVAVEATEEVAPEA